MGSLHVLEPQIWVPQLRGWPFALGEGSRMNSAQKDEVGTSSVCVKAGGCWPGAPICTAVPLVLSNCFSVRGLHNFSVITALMEDQTYFICVCQGFCINSFPLL